MTRCLSIHARYGCRHSGACCSAEWPIPIEADRLTGLRAALATRVVRPVDDAPPFITRAGASPDTPAVLGITSQRCVFLDDGPGGRCRIHRALGHEALPLACRQFPRISVLDPRGVSVTLSHYCPTAERLLDVAEPLAIVENPRAFPAGAEYVGLDARTSLPPLLRAGMLMDWEAWWEWERLSVQLIASHHDSRRALSDLHAIVERVRTWMPQEGALLDRIRETFAASAQAAPAPSLLSGDDAIADLLATVPDGVRPATIHRDSPPTEAVLRAFLAAHAFANWTAYVGQGLRAWLRSIETAFALVSTGVNVRTADLLLRHLADTERLTNLYNRAEEPRG